MKPRIVRHFQQRILDQLAIGGILLDRFSTIQAPAVSILRTISSGSRSTVGVVSGFWLIEALPELYSMRSRGNSRTSSASFGSVSSGLPTK